MYVVAVPVKLNTKRCFYTMIYPKNRELFVELLHFFSFVMSYLGIGLDVFHRKYNDVSWVLDHRTKQCEK